MIKCPYCNKDCVLFFCINLDGNHVVSCIPCAMKRRFTILEEVLEKKEVKDGPQGVETGNSRQGRSMSAL